MTIRYQNTFRDIVAFCFYHYPRSPLILGFYGFGFAILSAVVFQSVPKDIPIAARIIAFLVMEIIVFGFLAVIFILSTVLGMISRRNKTFLTDHSITLAENGFTSETPYSRSELKWSIVQKLARSKNYIFIYVAQHSAHVVPRRAFRDAAEWDSFYEFCRKKAQPV